MSAPLPVCVIGGCIIGMRHVEVAQAASEVQLTAVVETMPGRCAVLAAPGLPPVANQDDAPTETRACISSAPTQAHHDLGLEALRRGWGVMAEKPMAAKPDEGRALVEAATRPGLQLFIGHHRRRHPFSHSDRGEVPGVFAAWRH